MSVLPAALSEARAVSAEPHAAPILAINPNSDAACTAGIAAALGRLGGRFEVLSLPGGPPAVASWEDWHAVALPLARLAASREAAAVLIACVSDPGFDLLRSQTPRPVFGAFRCAVAAALARVDRFGVIAFAAPSVARQRRVLQAMGVEARCAASQPLGLPMAVLTDAEAPRPALAAAAATLRAAGAEAVILGCAGLAGHAAWLEAEAGLPVIEPIRAAGLAALGALP